MQRILVITKFRFIGDTLLAVPVFRAIHAHWPEAHITLLTGHNAHVLLQNNPLLEKILEFDPRGRDRGRRAFSHLVKTLRAQRFDLCLVLNRSFHSALIPALAGIPIRAGFRSEGRTWLLNRTVPYDLDKSEIDCYFDVLRAVAPQALICPDLELWLNRDECQEAAQRLQEALKENVPPSRLIGIQPGASLPEKCWDAERFAQVADALIQDDPNARIVLIGGPDERTAAKAMQAHCTAHTRQQTVDFVGRADLRGSLALVAHLGMLLGNDTAILHAGHALGVATVALFGPTNPRKWGAQGPRHCVLQAADGEMSSLTPQLVFQRVHDLRQAIVFSEGEGKNDFPSKLS